MTETVADAIARWTRRFEHDPTLADDLSDVLGEALERNVYRPTPQISVLLMALGRWQERQE